MVIRFAHSLAIVTFTVTLLRGIVAGDVFADTIRAAITTAIIFELLGLFCGDLARRVIEDSVEAELDSELRQLRSQAETSDSAQSTSTETVNDNTPVAA